MMISTEAEKNMGFFPFKSNFFIQDLLFCFHRIKLNPLILENENSIRSLDNLQNLANGTKLHEELCYFDALGN